MTNKKIYNVITISLIFLIGIIYSLSLGYTSVNPNDSGLPIDNDETEIVDETETPPSSDYNLGEGASAYERLEYAINQYNNSAGFTSTYYQTCLVMGNTQNIYVKKYRGDGYDITEEFFRMDGMFSSLGKNEFASCFSDGEIILEKTQTNNYDYDKKTYNADNSVAIKTYTVNQWENVLKKIKVNGFFTTINSSTTSIISYDGKARGKDYYSMKLSINVNKLDEPYLETFKNASDSFNIKLMTISLKISKATGNLISYEREDFFDGTTMGFTGSCEMRTKEVFHSMNKSAYSDIKRIALQNFNVTI